MALETWVKAREWLLFLTALLILSQLATGAALFYLLLGGTPEAVTTFYRGDAALFSAPKTVFGLLKTTLPHLIAMTVVGVFLLHLLSCTPRCKGILAALFFSGMILDISGGYLTLMHPLFVWGKLAGFFLLMAGAFGASWHLVRAATHSPE